MNSTSRIPVKHSNSGITIGIKVSGSLPDGGSDGQVLTRKDGKSVWANCPAGGENISAEAIENALGYVPADVEYVMALFEQLKALIENGGGGGSDGEPFGFFVDEEGNATIRGATLKVNENGDATFIGATLTVDDYGNATLTKKEEII